MRPQKSTIDWSSYVARFHDRRPGITDELLGPARDGCGRSPYDWLLEAVPSGALVVDVACGSAPIGRRPGLGAYLGLDRSAAELRRALDDGLSPERAALVRADVAALPLRSAIAEAVVASMALMVMPHLDAVLVEVARVLRPGGPFAAVVPVRDAAADDTSTVCFREMLAALGQQGQGYPESLDAATLAGRLAGAGLELTADERGRFVRTVTDGDCEMVASSFYAVGADPGAVGRAAARLRSRLVDGAYDLAYPLRRITAVRPHA